MVKIGGTNSCTLYNYTYLTFLINVDTLSYLLFVNITERNNLCRKFI